MIIWKSIRACLFVIMSLCAVVKPSMELSQRSECVMSSGIGVVAGLGKLLYDYHKNGKTLVKYQLGVGVGCGIVAALVAHAYLVQKTPEWQKKKEKERIDHFSNVFSDLLKDSFGAMQSIKEKLPKQHQSIIDYARITRDTAWPLCLAYNDIQQELEKTQRLQQQLMQQFEDVQEQQRYLITHAHSYKNEAVVVIKKIVESYEYRLAEVKQLLFVLNGYINQLINHTQFQTQLANYKAHVAGVERAVQNHERDMLHIRNQQERELARINAEVLLQEAAAVQRTESYQELQRVRGQLQQAQQAQQRNNDYAHLAAQRERQVETMQNIIRNLERRIAAQTPHSNGIEEQECSICLEKLGEHSIKTKCNHFFHVSCLEQALRHNNSCPNCRAINPTC